MTDTTHVNKMERIPEGVRDLPATDPKDEALVIENLTKWNVAKRLGITKESLKKNHPEIDRAEEKIHESYFGFFKKIMSTIGISGLLTAAASVFLPIKKVWIKVLTILAAGGLGAVIGYNIATRDKAVLTSFKPITKESANYLRIENAALLEEIAKIWHVDSVKLQQDIEQKLQKYIKAPQGLVDAFAEVPQFTTTLKKRDSDYAAQITKQAEQVAINQTLLK